MVTSEKILAVIPARGGSRSIPRKNIKLLGGHPLIAYSIVAGRRASLVGRVIVSTDDPEIARMAKALGAEVPFVRPAELAGDTVTDLPVFRHALQTLEESEDYRPDVVVQLRPTSPFRPPGAVDDAIRLLLESPEADSVRSVVPSGQNPYKMWKIQEGRLKPLLCADMAEPYNAPRQDLPATYWQTGQVDAIRGTTIIEKNSMCGDRILPVLMDPAYAVDLDTLDQWEFAEHVIRTRKLTLVMPERSRPSLSGRIRLVVSDFDGVLTDNRVWVSQDGREAVTCSREDGLGISRLQAMGIPFIILSTETNPVVSERARKLKAICFRSVRDKAKILDKIARERCVKLREVAYIGNDINDLEAFRAVGLAVAVADAHPGVIREADIVLERPGGQGAVRELCDLIMTANSKEDP